MIPPSVVMASFQDAAAAMFSDPLTTLGGLAILLLAYLMAKAFYNIYLHPLSSYPGPKLWTCNNLVFAYHNIKGDIHLHVASMHAEYGHIVRVNANALSYTSAEAWNDIYTLTRNKTELQRNPIFSLPKGAAGIFQCPSHEDHTRMRKVLRPAFSEKAMRDQGPTIVSYIDLLMTRLKERAGNGSVDMANWYTFTTFDVMGALTFGEDFDCLKESKYHEWIDTVLKFTRSITIGAVVKYLKPLDSIMAMLIPRSVIEAQKKHTKFTHDKLQRRIENKSAEPDFVDQGIQLIGHPDGMSLVELEKTSETLVIAGSDTTATLLTGATYILCKNPSKLARLTCEVRSAFTTESEITISSVNNLPYVLAVLDEALRLFPPVPGTAYRLTNPGGAVVMDKFVPGGILVGVSQWASARSERNFKDAQEFCPERWLGEDEKFEDDVRAARQPFSVGPRNCIGKSLAYTEMRLIIARLIWNFDIELADKDRDWFQDQKVFFLWEKRPLMMKLTPVKRQ